MRGYVYVLSNEAMPGLLKIGRSKAGGQHRGNQIYKGDTGTPLPFTLEFECFFEDCVEAEALVHEALQADRINEKREFFRTDRSEAIKALLGVAAGEIDCFIEDYDFGLVIGDSNVHLNCDYSDEVVPPDWAQILREVSADEARPAWERVKQRREKRAPFLAKGPLSEH